jgi:predicted unusual protein kinase regulating ubiquinone biosynthesis (AarF/ABC1/UbiB family)
MFYNIRKNVKSFFIILNAIQIILYESLLYLVFKNYGSFIDRLTFSLAKLNILYVKIFQAFALNKNLIDDNLNNKLIQFTDNAPYNEDDIDLEQLDEICEKYNIELLNQDKPINAGMISLVFKGIDKNNGHQMVIIKIKRKKIQEKLREAIDCLLFFMYLMSFIPIIDKYKLSLAVNKNITMIENQTNFLQEIENMEKMRENCKYLKYVKIPEAKKEVTNEYSDVILMEFIDGMTMNKIERKDYETFAKLVIKFGIVTTIIHGFIHGDLHSGNILFIKEEDTYKIGVIDFGITYSIEKENKMNLFEIFTQLFEKSPRELGEKFLNSVLLESPEILKTIPKQDYENILTFTEEIIKETIYSYKKANQLQLYKFLSQLKDYLSREELMKLGLKPSDHFFKLQLILAMSHGVTLSLCKDNFIELVDNVINEMFHTKMLLEE